MLYQFSRRAIVPHLVTTYSKVLEHIVYSYIFAHLCYLCDQQQHGFQHLRSYESQLILIANNFAETFNKGEQSDVVFLSVPLPLISQA